MTKRNTPEENRAALDRAKHPKDPLRTFTERDKRTGAERNLDEQRIVPHHARTVRA